MSDIEFLSVIAMMRFQQKQYFKTRYTKHLNESKRLEGIVDREISRRIGQEDKGALRLAYAKYDEPCSAQPTLGV